MFKGNGYNLCVLILRCLQVAVQLATASLAIMVASHNDASKSWPIIVGLLGQRIENAVLAK
jgi:hypothetical protein